MTTSLSCAHLDNASDVFGWLAMYFINVDFPEPGLPETQNQSCPVLSQASKLPLADDATGRLWFRCSKIQLKVRLWASGTDWNRAGRLSKLRLLRIFCSLAMFVS